MITHTVSNTYTDDLVMLTIRSLMIIFLGEQLWCLNGSTLENKANIWKTNDTLNLVDNSGGTTFFIKNVSNNYMLSIITEDKDNYRHDAINKVTSKDNAKQLWEKRNPNNKTCFIIAATGKVLTATFEGLKVKGNY